MRTSLRLRITLAVLALFAVVVAALAVGTGFALRGYLVGRLDADLVAAKDRALAALSTPLPPGPGDAVGLPGQSPGTLAAFIRENALVVAGVLDRYGRTLPLDDAQRGSLADAVDGRTVGTTFGAEVASLGAYRFTSVELREGAVLVMGLPMGDVDAVVGQYWWLAAAVAAGVLVVAGAGAWLLGAALQRTLARLSSALAAREASEGRLRRFIADASHELRTPLASIRGYAELTRRSGARLREDVRHSLDRIESESVRMTGLVEDLLLLARADEARSLAQQPVELGQLVATAVADAQVAAPGHTWSVEAPAPVIVAGDEPRLHQAVANLLRNAAVHTPDGTNVVARVRVEGGDAVVEVEDDGPGIQPELVGQVFGRFVRGDASRSRATGSTGLGLAIVEAVAQAHGGSADVESAAGRTRFRIVLPAQASP
ncbi:MAG: two-component sensor histidine kinase [Microbacteriaceae bacterium]|nr:two-component sensor histidine kinase [Microbacteriaceae bacterium]